MDLQLRGRNCLITGASAGIGAKTAEILASEGVRVVLTARRRDRLEELAERIGKAGHTRPEIVTGDILEPGEIRNIALRAAELVGPIEILVNCAGSSIQASLDDGDDRFDDAYNLNFRSTRRMTAEVLPGMRKARWGRIINLTALMEPMRLSASMPAKAAVHNWAKGLSREVAAEGITVNSVAPGRIETEQVMTRLYPTEESRRAFAERHIPVGYFGKPEDPARLIAFLVSPLAGYITGAMVPVDGGMKLT